MEVEKYSEYLKKKKDIIEDIKEKFKDWGTYYYLRKYLIFTFLEKELEEEINNNNEIQELLTSFYGRDKRGHISEENATYLDMKGFFKEFNDEEKQRFEKFLGKIKELRIFNVFVVLPVFNEYTKEIVEDRRNGCLFNFEALIDCPIEIIEEYISKERIFYIEDENTENPLWLIFLEKYIEKNTEETLIAAKIVNELLDPEGKIKKYYDIYLTLNRYLWKQLNKKKEIEPNKKDIIDILNKLQEREEISPVGCSIFGNLIDINEKTYFFMKKNVKKLHEQYIKMFNYSLLNEDKICLLLHPTSYEQGKWKIKMILEEFLLAHINICNFNAKNIIFLDRIISDEINKKIRKSFTRKIVKYFYTPGVKTYSINMENIEINEDAYFKFFANCYIHPESLRKAFFSNRNKNKEEEFKKCFDIYTSFYNYYDLYRKVFKIVFHPDLSKKFNVIKNEEANSHLVDFLMDLMRYEKSTILSVENIYNIVKGKEEFLSKAICDVEDSYDKFECSYDNIKDTFLNKIKFE